MEEWARSMENDKDINSERMNINEKSSNNAEMIKKVMKKGASFLCEAIKEVYDENSVQAFNDATEIGVSNMIAAMYEAGVDDDLIIKMLNKYWRIEQQDAVQRIVFEKQELCTRELSRYLQLQGYSEGEIHTLIRNQRVEIKIRHNKELLKLWNNPQKLLKEIQRIK